MTKTLILQTDEKQLEKVLIALQGFEGLKIEISHSAINSDHEKFPTQKEIIRKKASSFFNKINQNPDFQKSNYSETELQKIWQD